MMISWRGVLLASLLPLWALWGYTYVTLLGFQGGMEMLPRFYGMHLYKENLRGQLSRLSVVVAGLVDGKEVKASTPGDNRAFPAEELETTIHMAGFKEMLLVVHRHESSILYPEKASGGTLSFVQDDAYRKSFFRTLMRMNASGAQEGYFSVSSGNPLDTREPSRWFIEAVPVNKDLWCIGLVPEKDLKMSGNILQAAQQAFVEERVERFLYTTLPILVPISLLVILLCYPRAGRRSGENKKEKEC